MHGQSPDQWRYELLEPRLRCHFHRAGHPLLVRDAIQPTQDASPTVIAGSETSNTNWIAQMDVDFADTHSSANVNLSMIVYV